MRLVDRYEEELLEAARRLGNEPARRERARRTLGRAGRGLAWVPAVVVVGLAVAISAVIMTGGREPEQAHPARLVGWYASPVDSGQPLPKGAPQGSTLRLERDGRYRLTTDVYRVSGRYQLRREVLGDPDHRQLLRQPLLGEVRAARGPDHAADARPADGL